MNMLKKVRNITAVYFKLYGRQMSFVQEKQPVLRIKHKELYQQHKQGILRRSTPGKWLPRTKKILFIKPAQSGVTRRYPRAKVGLLTN